jgi:hypothetical protein
MAHIPLESLARSVDALEAAEESTAGNRPAEDWRRVVGMFADSEFMREVDEECRRAREAEREAARREPDLG